MLLGGSGLDFGVGSMLGSVEVVSSLSFCCGAAGSAAGWLKNARYASGVSIKTVAIAATAI